MLFWETFSFLWSAVVLDTLEMRFRRKKNPKFSFRRKEAFGYEESDNAENVVNTTLKRVH
jgi:hypothetical protein